MFFDTITMFLGGPAVVLILLFIGIAVIESMCPECFTFSDDE